MVEHATLLQQLKAGSFGHLNWYDEPQNDGTQACVLYSGGVHLRLRYEPATSILQVHFRIEMLHAAHNDWHYTGTTPDFVLNSRNTSSKIRTLLSSALEALRKTRQSTEACVAQLGVAQHASSAASSLTREQRAALQLPAT